VDVRDQIERAGQQLQRHEPRHLRDLLVAVPVRAEPVDVVGKWFRGCGLGVGLGAFVPALLGEEADDREAGLAASGYHDACRR